MLNLFTAFVVVRVHRDITDSFQCRVESGDWRDLDLYDVKAIVNVKVTLTAVNHVNQTRGGYIGSRYPRNATSHLQNNL